MRMRIPTALLLVALCALPAMVFGQQQKPKPTGPAVVMEYFENNSANLAIKDSKGKDVEFDIGTRILPGWTVVTDRGDLAELKLDPNGTIIKIAQMTNFKVDSLQTAPGESNSFSVAIGKIRAVAGKATGKEKYTVRGPSAVCGVRGTDFGMDVGTETETAFVLDGLIDFTNAAGQTIQIAKGMMADALAATFQPLQIPPALLESLQKDMAFSKLNPLEVPGHEGAQAPQPPAEPAKPDAAAAAAAAKPGVMDGIMAWLRDRLGMEIGAITIDNTTYSKVVIAPNFALGNLKLGLYLPIIYSGDMFNPADYYKPAGNNEWDFGTKTPGTWDPLDAAKDLMLKIKYVEWGAQRDPFFFKVGNLNDITIGHGLIMRDYANNADFPAIRRVGVNVGMDLGGFGLELMDNDATLWPAQVVGGRIFVRPIPGFRAALGLSLVADLNPAADIVGAGYTVESAGSPIFFNPGMDLDLPFFETKPFAIIGFADVAGMLPFFRSATNIGVTSGTVIPAGFAWNALYSQGAPIPFKNYGFAAGLLGNILMIDYRLEYRYFTGTFKPAVYDSGYDRSRTQYVLDVLKYLSNPADPAYNNVQMGIYGEGGFKLEKLLNFSMGYFWPWAFDDAGKMVPDGDDHFVMRLAIEKGAIPIVKAWGSVSYERTKFIPTIMQNTGGAGLNLFDANTVVTAQVSYGVADSMDLVLLYTTTAHRDGSGGIVYTPGSLLPQLDTTLTIETSLHF